MKFTAVQATAGEPHLIHSFSRMCKWASCPFWPVLILGVFAVVLNASLWDKSPTADELVHITGGYTYWCANDYRINPENGNLPQRLAALPLLFGNYKSPLMDEENWRACDEWRLSYGWFYLSGNSERQMLILARASCSLLAVALGITIWLWARELFGSSGGAVALLSYVLCPSILANGALTTSDTASTLFFLLSVYTSWKALGRLTLGWAIASGGATGCLLLSKMSGPLVFVVLGALLAVRTLRRKPFVMGAAFGWAQPKPWSRSLAIALGITVHLAVSLVIVWAAYGFRYEMFNGPTKQDQLRYAWDDVLGRPRPREAIAAAKLTSSQQAEVLSRVLAVGDSWDTETQRVFETICREVLTDPQRRMVEQELSERRASAVLQLISSARRCHLLPEAYLYGHAYAWTSIMQRAGFLNGKMSMNGWRYFFPYTVLVKTPIPLMLIFGVSVFTLLSFNKVQGWHLALYRTAPLWVLIAVYWSVAVSSHINIGHRHILVTYPPALILCGAVALRFRGRLFRWRASGEDRGAIAAIPAAIFGLIGVCALEDVYRFPNYIAYFNQLVGGPSYGYRHLIDSSLDWGQELPAVREFTEKHRGETIYFSYFGNGDPRYYGIRARYLCSFPGWRNLRLRTVMIAEVDGSRADEHLSELLREYPEYDPKVSGVLRGEGISLAVMLKRTQFLKLEPGIYLISASMLQSILYPVSGPWGAWSSAYEDEYQELYDKVRPFLLESGEEKWALFSARSPEEWLRTMDRFDAFRFGRLTAYLRKREPDGNIGFSVLIYNIGREELEQALNGPAPLPDLTIQYTH